MLLLLSHSVVANSFVISWTVGHQALLSKGFLRQEWSELLFPSPGDLPSSGMESALQFFCITGCLFTTESPGKPAFC